MQRQSLSGAVAARYSYNHKHLGRVVDFRYADNYATGFVTYYDFFATFAAKY